MRSLIVIEVKVAAKAVESIFGCDIVMQVDFLVFERPPETLGKDVIQRPPFSIHADAHFSSQEPG